MRENIWKRGRGDREEREREREIVCVFSFEIINSILA